MEDKIFVWNAKDIPRGKNPGDYYVANGITDEEKQALVDEWYRKCLTYEDWFDVEI